MVEIYRPCLTCSCNLADIVIAFSLRATNQRFRAPMDQLDPDQLDVWWRRNGAASGEADGTQIGAANRAPASHSALRRILANYGSGGALPPRFIRDGQGKLRLCDEALSFSISHGQDFTAFVIANGAEVGIDCEAVTPRPDLMALAEHCFSAAERARLATIAEHEFLRSFYTFWTRKEALLKAIGVGLSYPMAGLDTANGGLFSACAVAVPSHGTYWVASIEAPRGYVAACASRRSFRVAYRTPGARSVRGDGDPTG